MDKEIQLDIIAARLEGLEETIIAKLIDRVQFRNNARCYRAGESGFRGSGNKSLLDIRLYYQEQMDAQFGRYHIPEERPFNSDLPASRREVLRQVSGLRIDDYNLVNLNGKILGSYLSLIPEICPEGDDLQYGSSTVADVYALQAIAERIHFGSFYVAESKFRDDPPGYRALIDAGDEAGMMRKLTRIEVEERILDRVREKVAYSQARVNTQVRHLLEPEMVLRYYRDHIIPLTKQGEILYLKHRKI